MSSWSIIPRPLTRRPRRLRAEGRRTRRALGASLISAAGLAGVAVRNQRGDEVGRVADVVARWTGLRYPPVTGLVLRIGRRRAFVGIEQIAAITSTEVTLSSARVDLRDFAAARRGGGADRRRDRSPAGRRRRRARVIRAADLYLAHVGAALPAGRRRRRASGRCCGGSGRASRRRRAAPNQVIDWAAIEPFSEPGRNVKLRRSGSALERLRPSELATLLEELGRAQRQELLSRLAPAVAADALEEMDEAEAAPLLLDLPVEQAGRILGRRMEPDEAVGVLRDIDEAARAGAARRGARHVTPSSSPQLLAFPGGPGGRPDDHRVHPRRPTTTAWRASARGSRRIRARGRPRPRDRRRRRRPARRRGDLARAVRRGAGRHRRVAVRAAVADRGPARRADRGGRSTGSRPTAAPRSSWSTTSSARSAASSPTTSSTRSSSAIAPPPAAACVRS